MDIEMRSNTINIILGQSVEKLRGVSWWIESLGKSQCQNLRGHRPWRFLQRDFPRDSISPWLMDFFHHINFYTLPFCSLGHAISKTVSLSYLASTSRVGKILTPPNLKGPPLGWKIWQVVGLLILITQMKGFSALNATQKTSALCKDRWWKNQGNLAKMVKNSQNGQKWPFLLVFLVFFSGMVLCRELKFFFNTLHLSYQNQQSNNFSFFSP